MTTLVHTQPPQATPSSDLDPRAFLADLESQLYGHCQDAINFDALYHLEELLWGLLDRRGIADEDGDLARTLIVDAVSHVMRDPASYCPVSPPPGITKAEAKAVEFDDACPFCHMERQLAAYANDPANIAAELAEDAELRAFYAEDARAWRAKHAEQLARATQASSGEPARNRHATPAASAAAPGGVQ